MISTCLKLVAIGIVLLSLSTAFGDAPLLINYQGRLTDDGGHPLDTVVRVTFRIYDSPNGDGVVWSETHPSLTVTDGFFDVFLGSITEIPESVFVSRFRWLGIELQDRPELFPRSRIVSVPYAYETIRADTAQYSFETMGGVKHWTAIDSILYTDNLWGLARGNSASVLFGDGAYTMINFGLACTTGVGGLNNIYPAVMSGYKNVAGGNYSFVGGGVNDKAYGQYSAVTGGKDNIAEGDYSYAGGHHAHAAHNGSFVWADAFDTTFTSMRNNQFRVRAHGGARFDINDDNWIEIFDDGVGIITSNTGARLTIAGIWANASDRNLKENFTPVDGEKILEKLRKLDVTQWNFKSEDDSIIHIGPIAQDFYELFGLGNGNTTISTVDPNGIALVAIQELSRKTDRIDSLEAQVRELQRRLDQLIANQER